MKRCVLICAAVLVAGCTKVGSGPEQPGGARGPHTVPHVLRMADAEDVAGLNPHLVQQAALSYMSSLTMAFLVKYDANNKPYPELLTEIPTQANHGISADGKTITWHLRKDAKWSDGVPFTADDMVFSTQAVLNPKNNEVSRDGWELITKVDEPDKFTVVYHLKSPYSIYLPNFFGSAGANPSLLPKHLLAQFPDINHVAYNALPVGIGPFKYKEWKRGEYVEMVDDPLYFRGKPKLEKVYYEIIPDRNTVFTQLQTGQIDLWLLTGTSVYPRLKALPGIQTQMIHSYFIPQIDFNTAHTIVADPLVRQALRFATDRQGIVNKFAHGIGTVQDTPVSPAVDVFDGSLGVTPFDVAKASALLDQAGWKRGPDGIRVKNGQRLVLDFAAGSGQPDFDHRIEFFRTGWRRAGADLVVKHYPPSLMFAPMASGGIIYNGKFDAAAFSWGSDPVNDLSILYSCGRIPPNGQNVMRYCNRGIEHDFAAFRATYDPAQRKPIQSRIQAAVVRDVPSLVFDSGFDIFAYNKDLTGFHPGTAAPLDGIMSVDI